MKTRVVSVAEEPAVALEAGITELKRGAIVAFPTETVYGLGVCYGNPEAEQRLRRIKRREAAKPFQILIDDPGRLETLGCEVNQAARRLIDRFWPGPLTLVLPAEGATLGVRLPDLALVRDLASGCGGAIVATSANPAAEPPAVDAEEVLRAFAGQIALLLDGGSSIIGTASSVVRVDGAGVQMLRCGAIGEADIRVCAAGEE